MRLTVKSDYAIRALAELAARSQQGGLVNVAAANGSFNNVLNNNLNNSLNGNNVNVLGVQVVGPTALLGDATSAIS